MAVLLGTHNYQLDQKGRITLPGKFREAFADGAFLTLGQDGCLLAFPPQEWERVSAEVDEESMQSADGRAYSRIFFGSAESMDLDSQGRLTVPQRLRQLVDIKKESVVVGVRDRMEIWDRATYERYQQKYEGAYQSGSISPGGRRQQ